MIILAWIAILGLIVAGGFFAVWAESRDRLNLSIASGVATILLGLFWIIGTGAVVVGYFRSVSDYGDLRGVRDSFISVEQSIEMTRDTYYAVYEKALMDTANLKQSTNVSEAIASARNTILEYNRKLQKYITLRSYSPTKLFCAPVPSDLKPLVWSGIEPGI